MDKKEHDKIKKELVKLNLTNEEKSKIEVLELKKELAKVKKDFNDYLLHTQTKTIPHYEEYKLIFRNVENERNDIQLKFDSLLNFVFENGLGKKYYSLFVNDYYPYDVLDFRITNEVNTSRYMNKNTNSNVRYKLMQFYSQN